MVSGSWECPALPRKRCHLDPVPHILAEVERMDEWCTKAPVSQWLPTPKASVLPWPLLPPLRLSPSPKQPPPEPPLHLTSPRRGAAEGTALPAGLGSSLSPFTGAPMAASSGSEHVGACSTPSARGAVRPGRAGPLPPPQGSKGSSSRPTHRRWGRAAGANGAGAHFHTVRPGPARPRRLQWPRRRRGMEAPADGPRPA